MSRFTDSAAAFFREWRLRELILWCLPALIVALVLRVVLSMHLPYAYYHDDGPDFLTTPDRLIHDHKFELHEKKTFLVPILFTIPFALPAPAMITIPILQHVLGLVLVVLVGALVRAWFAQWKLFIVPLTLLAAINPFYLWYERTLMAETTFLVTTVLVTLTGTLYAQQQTKGRFVAFCVALVLEAGGRPEGKLLFGFGLFLLALLHWKEWRASWPRLAIMLVVGIVTHFCTKTSQAGLLLYTSVARLTPTKLTCAPGFDPYINEIRTDLQQRWAQRPSFPRVRDRRTIAAAVDKYLKEKGTGATKHEEVNAFCLKLAKETCLRSVSSLPSLALTKFRAVANESPAGKLDNALLFTKQREALNGSMERFLRLSNGLIGHEVKDAAEANQWLDTHYGEVPWFNWLDETWLAVVNHFRLPDAVYPHPMVPSLTQVFPGIPLYFIVALVGVVAAMFRRGEMQALHVAWGLTLLAFFFTIMLTANVRPRFRFVFEPFWFLYIAFILDWVCSLFRRKAEVKA